MMRMAPVASSFLFCTLCRSDRCCRCCHNRTTHSQTFTHSINHSFIHSFIHSQAFQQQRRQLSGSSTSSVSSFSVSGLSTGTAPSTPSKKNLYQSNPTQHQHTSYQTTPQQQLNLLGRSLRALGNHKRSNHSRHGRRGSRSSLSSSTKAASSSSSLSISSSCFSQQDVQSVKNQQKLNATMDVLMNVVCHLGVVPAPSLAALEDERQHDPRRVLETCQRYLRCTSQSDEDVIESVILVPAWEQLCRLQHGHCRQTAKLLQQYKNERSLGVAGMWDKICQTQQEYYESAEELSACELGLYKAQRRQQIRLKRQKYRQRQQQKSQAADESSSSSIDGVECDEPFGDDPGSVTRRPTFP